MSTAVLIPKVGVSHLPLHSVNEVAEAMTEAKVIFYIYIYSEIS